MKYILEVDKRMQKAVLIAYIYKLASKHKITVDISGVYIKKEYDNGYVKTHSKLAEFEVQDGEGMRQFIDDLKIMGALWEVKN